MLKSNIRKIDWQKLEPSLFGWGINDVNYKVSIKATITGAGEGKRKRKKVWMCPYYEDWYAMLRRSFSERYIQDYPAYKGCTVCQEWKYLSKFIEWVDSQPNRDWQNCALDKDFLYQGNRHYSPNTCVYIPQGLNSFIVNRANHRGELMLGVVKGGTKSKPYRATCSDPFTKKNEYLGCFKIELDAHKAWQAKKHEHACKLADMQEDDRIDSRLREMYAPDKDWADK